MEKLQKIFASAWAAVVTVSLVTIVTIGAELSASFKTGLTSVTGHHWLTKSWLSVGVFLIVFLVVRAARPAPSPDQTRRALLWLEVVVSFGFVALLGFFIDTFLD